MELQAPKHDLKTWLWCGPAAVSICTGRPTSEIAEAMRTIRDDAKDYDGRPATLFDLRNTMAFFGLRLRTIREFLGEEPEGPPLITYLHEQQEDFRDTPCMIHVRGHVLVAHGRQVCDNNTRHFVSPECLHREFQQRRVKGVWRVEDKNAAANAEPQY